MSRFADTTLYTLALLAKQLAHMTIISQDYSLVSYRGFKHLNAEIHKHFVHRIHDIPILDFSDVALLSGPFPKATLISTRPFKMDGLDLLS
jgi:hypothetical protein